MRVTILTVCFNSENTIEDTIKSVINQSYQDIEYIVIDGKSNDSTLEIVNRYHQYISRVVSEKDKGMYDACNKGISIAKGEIIGILNSDDVLAHKDVIRNVVRKFQEEGSDALYGDLKYVAQDDLRKTLRYWKSGGFRKSRFLFGWMPPHPTFYIRKEAYAKHGGFNLKLRSAADYELMLRMLFKNKVSVSYLPEVMVLMRDGGMSNATMTNRLKANQEDQSAWRMNDLKAYFFTTWLKPIRKIPQFLFKGQVETRIPLMTPEERGYRQVAA